MSTLSEIFDRLTGIGPMKETQKMLETRIERFATLLLEHERRLVRLETVADIKRLGPPKRK
jgi:hypothetical protein